MPIAANSDMHSYVPLSCLRLHFFFLRAEHVHKKSGYVAVSLGIVTVAIGTSLVATVQKHYLPAFIVALVILVAGASLARNDATKTKMHAQI